MDPKSVVLLIKNRLVPCGLISAIVRLTHREPNSAWDYFILCASVAGRLSYLFITSSWEGGGRSGGGGGGQVTVVHLIRLTVNHWM